MKFIAFLNKTVDLPVLMNGLSHMCVGLGHRLNGAPPQIQVYWGDNAQIRAFRTAAYQLNQNKPENTIFNDFPHTMSGENTVEKRLLEYQTCEEELNYFGACYAAEQIDESLAEIIDSSLQLADYINYVGQNDSNFLPLREKIDYLGEARKIVLLINNKFPLKDTIHQVIMASLMLGQQTPYDDLYLQDIKDGSGSIHPNISFHSLVVLKPASHAKYASIISQLDSHANIVSVTLRNENSQPLVTASFGTINEIESVITKKNTQLYKEKLNQNLVGVSLITDNSRSEVGSSSSHGASRFIFMPDKSPAVEIKGTDNTNNKILDFPKLN